MKKFNTHDSFVSRIRLLFLIAAVLAISACSSVRFTYNNGDTLLYYWLNAYVDIDTDQSDWVRKDIDQLFQWHRTTQLKDYVQLLEKSQRQLAGNPTQADLLADYRDIRGRAEKLANKAVPDLAELAISLKPDQINKLARKFESNNDKYRKKFLRGDADDRNKLRYKKAMEQFELWFGNFSGEQEAVLRRASDARPLDNETWLDERMRRQQMILALLRKVNEQKLNREQTVPLVQGLVRDVFARMDSPERKPFYDASIDGTTKMVLAALKIATPAQKAHAHKRMQGWIDDFRALAAAGRR